MNEQEYKAKLAYYEQLSDDTELNIFRTHYCGVTSDEERDKQLQDLKEELKSIKENLKNNN